MTQAEIDEKKKQLNEELDRLVELRNAKALALQQRQEAFNADRFLADLYTLDPNAANFFADKMIAEKRIQAQTTERVYSPEQKALVDAKQQNRIRMGEVQKSRDAAGNETDRTYWDNQYKALFARDVNINNKLAELGTPGYSFVEQGVIDEKKKVDAGGGKIVISPTVNSDKYIEFASTYNRDNYKNPSDVPNADKIRADASKLNYDISSDDAKNLRDGVYQQVVDRNNEAERRDETSRKILQDQLSQEEKAATFGMMVSGIENLKKNPSSQNDLNSVLTSLLRIESGAAIGSEEYLNRAKDFLSPADYDSFISELSSPSLAIKNKILNGTADADVMRIQAKYISRMNPKSIINRAELAVPEKYYKINKARIEKSTSSPKTEGTSKFKVKKRG